MVYLMIPKWYRNSIVIGSTTFKISEKAKEENDNYDPNTFLDKIIEKERQNESAFLGILRQKLGSSISLPSGKDWKIFIAYINSIYSSTISNALEYLETITKANSENKSDVDEELLNKIIDIINEHKKMYEQGAQNFFTNIGKNGNSSIKLYGNKIILKSGEAGDFLKEIFEQCNLKIKNAIGDFYKKGGEKSRRSVLPIFFSDEYKELEKDMNAINNVNGNMPLLKAIVDFYSGKKGEEITKLGQLKKKVASMGKNTKKYAEKIKGAGAEQILQDANAFVKNYKDMEIIETYDIVETFSARIANLFSLEKENPQALIMGQDYKRKIDSLVSLSKENEGKIDCSGLFNELIEYFNNKFGSGNKSYSAKDEAEAIVQAFKKFLSGMNTEEEKEDFLKDYLGIEISTKQFNENGFYEENGIKGGSLGCSGKIDNVIDNLNTIFESASFGGLNKEESKLLLLNCVSGYKLDSRKGIDKFLLYITSAATMCMFSSSKILCESIRGVCEGLPHSLDFIHLFDFGGQYVPLSYALDSLRQQISLITQTAEEAKVKPTVVIKNKEATKAADKANKNVLSASAKNVKKSVPKYVYDTYGEETALSVLFKFDFKAYLEQVKNFARGIGN